ncbi:MAG: hypothetical protein Q9215_004448 [Flavoplaca cf. flavocitrina]
MTGLLLSGVIVLVVYIASCVLAAAGIIENMHSDYHQINPCDDFSKYVCGGWEAKHDLRPDQDSVSSGSVMYEKSQETLRRLLEAPYSDSQSSSVSTSASANRLILDKIQSAYNACMDEGAIQQRGAKPLLDVLGKVQEHYPRPSNIGWVHGRNMHQSRGQQSDSNERLTSVVVYLSSIGVDAFVTFSTDADDKDPDSVVLSLNALSRPGLPSKEYYQDQGLLKAYGETMGQVLEALLREAHPSPQLGVDASTIFECSEELVKAVVDLEKNLAFASPDEADAEDVTKYYNPRSLTEIHALLPQLSMPYLLSLLAPSGYEPAKVIVGSPSYLEALAQQLNDADYETLRAYLVWKTVQAYVDEVEDEALRPLKRFNNRLRGKEPDAVEERWRTCVKVVDRGLGWILSKFFVEETFSQDAKAFGDRIIRGIKSQFVEKLSVAGWMSKDVRNVAIEKVHRIVQKIGYPTRSPDLLDAEAVEKYYQGVQVTNDSYFDNALSVAKFDAHREWSKLGKPTNRDEWLMTAVTVNVDEYQLRGRHYDQTGNYTDWWDDKTVQAFKAKTECFVEQYSNFTILDPEGKTLHVNGKLTLGENIADAGGLSAAFHAWKEIEKTKPSQLLPGLQHFTKEQMFFITYPSLFCAKTRQERAVNLIYKDPHSPAWARILGTVANSREFQEAFDCPKKEPTYNIDPRLDRDENPHPTFTFWKTGARQFRDPKDCWEQCQSCLRRGIEAGRAVTTQCNYQANKLQLGSTCEMGFEWDTIESLAKIQPGGLNNPARVSLGQWEPYWGWKGTVNQQRATY